ncbi:hypothetical protein DSM3645_26654 [Blastopirellula marina DSM 3645]|uniref:DUF4159 domain-containing protein n=2 Tax=Blastopirellula marina TaxID=124 RepID=A3ZY61_9BACT|nr:hypothetical protein DSM3645_26654 [Blastopirellula marina DSM 3645]
MTLSLVALLLGIAPHSRAADSATDTPVAGAAIPDSAQTGGEAESIVQVANLVYAGVRSSKCFSDHFLILAEQETAISTSRRFHAVKLASERLYDYPMVIMTGEGAFELPESERQSLRRYIERGGFLLASAGCSSEEWNRSFRAEMAEIFPTHALTPLNLEHPIFHTVSDITELTANHGSPQPIEGVSISGRIGVIFSQDGLNDTRHTQGCCCCGGNEIRNAEKINVNILAYALTY